MSLLLCRGMNHWLGGRRISHDASSNHDDYATGATTWSTKDRARLQRAIDPLHSKWGKQPLGFLHSEASALLCAPPEEVYDRLLSFLSTCGIVSGLVLSAFAGVALNPLRRDDYPEEKRSAVELFNVVAAITVAMQLGVSLYSTFTSYLVIASVHNPSAVYRAVVHMQRWIGFLEFATFVPALGAFALIILAAHLHCSALAGRIVLLVTCATFAGCHAGFILMCWNALPYNSWMWATMASFSLPWLSCTGIERDARRHGELLIAQAKDGVLSGLDANNDYIVDSTEDEASESSSAGQQQRKEASKAAEAELTSWVADAVGSSSEMQRALLVEQLLAAGLTKSRLVEAAAYTGGFQALCVLFESAEVGARPGDRLALATAAMRESEGRAADAAARE